MKKIKGFSLIEMLVVVAVFSFVAIIATQSLVDSLRGSRKSENIGTIKTSLEYSLSSMERVLRNSQDITCVGNTRLNFTDENNIQGWYECLTDASGGFISSDSASTAPARLTSSKVDINSGCTTAVFTCDNPLPPSLTPSSVNIMLIGRDLTTSGAESGQATARTKILLRTY